ncbi:S-layer homology domain-containing protein [Metabacillus iocasae]|uniref:Fibronectin type-III domain-containing protein n=1 Tax=Priestia iocasae TaxID=2291674 RepID=A0ABS2QS39_9BACI|nr:S-layer homology domain-containing protein [Metabacillus iocasae]MBM7702264.1 hypothetical protein [Metabacillus iocasae]
MSKKLRVLLSFVLVLSLVLPSVAPVVVKANEDALSIDVELKEDYQLDYGYVEILEATGYEGNHYTYVDYYSMHNGNSTFEVNSSVIKPSKNYLVNVKLDLLIGTKKVVYVNIVPFTGEELLQATQIKWNDQTEFFSPDYASAGLSSLEAWQLNLNILGYSSGVKSYTGVLADPSLVKGATVTGFDNNSNVYQLVKTFKSGDATENFSLNIEKDHAVEITFDLGSKYQLSSLEIRGNDSSYAYLYAEGIPQFSGKLYVTRSDNKRVSITIKRKLNDHQFSYESLELLSPSFKENRTLKLEDNPIGEVTFVKYNQSLASPSLNINADFTRGDFRIGSVHQGFVVDIVNSDNEVVNSFTVDSANFYKDNLNLPPGDYTALIRYESTEISAPFKVMKLINLNLPNDYSNLHLNRARITEVNEGENMVGPSVEFFEELSIENVKGFEIVDTKRYQLDAIYRLKKSNNQQFLYYHTEIYTGLELKNLSSITFNEDAHQIIPSLTNEELQGLHDMKYRFNNFLYGAYYYDWHGDDNLDKELFLLPLILSKPLDVEIVYSGSLDKKTYIFNKVIKSSETTFNFVNERVNTVKLSIEDVQGSPYKHKTIGLVDSKNPIWTNVPYDSNIYVTAGQKFIEIESIKEETQDNLYWNTQDKSFNEDVSLSFNSSLTFTLEHAYNTHYESEKGSESGLYIEQKLTSGDFILGGAWQNQSLNMNAAILDVSGSTLQKQQLEHTRGIWFKDLVLPKGTYKYVLELNNPFTNEKETFEEMFSIDEQHEPNTHISTSTQITSREVVIDVVGKPNETFNLIAQQGEEKQSVGSGKVDEKGYAQVTLQLTEGAYDVFAEFDSGDVSNYLYITVDQTAPVAPELAVVKEGEDNKFTLSWNVTENGLLYDVYVKENEEYNLVKEKVKETTYVFNGKPGVVYAFKVVAYDQAGNEITSNEIEQRVNGTQFGGNVTQGNEPLTDKAIVTLYNSTSSFVFETDEVGSFEQVLPKGSYSIDVEYKRELSRNVGSVDIGESPIDKYEIKIPERHVQKNVKFNVIDTSSKPITLSNEYLWVNLHNETTGTYLTGYVSKNGVLRNWTGKEEFINLPTGVYTYSISGDGLYEATTGEFAIEKEIDYIKNPISLSINKVDIKETDVKFSVVDEDGNPIKEAFVQLSSYDVANKFGYNKGTILGKTNDDGSVTLKAIHANDYYITVSASNYVPYSNMNKLKVENTTQTQTITLTQAQALKGKVLMPNGPYIHASVSAYTDDYEYYSWKQADDNGEFVFENAPKRGKLNLFVHAPGYKTESTQKTINLNEVQGSVEINLQRETVLKGKILDNNQKPVPFAWINVNEVGGHTVAWASSSRHGTYEIYGLKAGKEYEMEVGASRQPSVKEAFTFELEGDSNEMAKNVTLVNNSASTFTGEGNTFSSSATTVAPGKTIKYRLDYKNNGSDATNVPLGVTIPTDVVELVEGSVILNNEKQAGLTGLKVSPKANATGVLTFEVKVKEDTPAEAVDVSAKIGSGTDERAFNASTTILNVTLNAPATTSSKEIKVYGSAKDGATVDVYAGSQRLATVKTEGRWWYATVTLPEGETHTLTARVKDGTDTYTSKPVEITYEPEVPNITDVTVTAGWNKNVKLNPNTGIATMAISEFTPIDVDVTFDKHVDSAKILFLGEEVALTKNGKTFTGQYPAGWSSYGERLFELAYTVDGKDYLVPLIEVLVLIDPSGYVFEGSMQERLQGVTAIVEEEKNSVWTQWNAERYGQVNPQTTTEDGRYGWDVPVGNWRVVFSKEGYDSYISRHVVVPPPETQLNVPLVRTSAPEVKGITPAKNATNIEVKDSITVEFDRLMNEAGKDNIKLYEVTNNGDVAISGNFTLENKPGYKLVDAPGSTDSNGQNGFFEEDPNKLLSKTFTFKPAADLKANTTYKIVVDGNMVDYDGKRLGQNVEQTFTTKAQVAPTPPPSNGGGGSTPPPTPAPVPAPEVEGDKATIGNDGVAVSGNEVTVKEDALNEVLKNKEVSEVKVEVKQDVTKAPAEVKLPAASLLQNKEAIDRVAFAVETSAGSYQLPLSALPKSVVENLKAGEEIIVSIGKTTVKNAPDFTYTSDVIEFSVFVQSGDKKVEVKTFSKPVERSITLKNKPNVDRAVGIVLHEDGSFRAVPTYFAGNEAIMRSYTNSAYVIIEEVVTFKDVTDKQWNKAQIEKLASKFIVQGKGDGTFAPNDGTSRLQLALLLTRSLGLVSTEKYDGRFSDVKGDEWFAAELLAAVESGIIKGKVDGTFAPHEKVTRAQAAAMISRALAYVGYDKKQLDTTKDINTFNDHEAIAEWVQGDVRTVLQANIITGKANGNFDPNGHTTRAQMVKMLDELLQFVGYTNK